MILEALKEELFQLEVERKQGKITTEEYEKAKAALDQTLERALKRRARSCRDGRLGRPSRACSSAFACGLSLLRAQTRAPSI